MMPQRDLNEGLLGYSKSSNELDEIFQNNEMRKLTSNMAREIFIEEKGGEINGR